MLSIVLGLAAAGWTLICAVLVAFLANFTPGISASEVPDALLLGAIAILGLLGMVGLAVGGAWGPLLIAAQAGGLLIRAFDGADVLLLGALVATLVVALIATWTIAHER